MSWCELLHSRLVQCKYPVAGGSNYILDRLYFGCRERESARAYTASPVCEVVELFATNTPTANPSYTAWNAGTTKNNGTISAASPYLLCCARDIFKYAERIYLDLHIGSSIHLLLLSAYYSNSLSSA